MPLQGRSEGRPPRALENPLAARGALVGLRATREPPPQGGVAEIGKFATTTRAKALTWITPGPGIGSDHHFLARIRAPNTILAGGSRIRGSDLIPNTLTLSAVIRTLRVSYAVTKLLVVSKHS